MSRDITPEELSEAHQRINALTRQLEEKEIMTVPHQRINALTRQLEEKEIMTVQRFALVVYATVQLLQKGMRRQGNAYDLIPKRCPGLESAPEHLAWMLDEAMVFHVEGRVQKANRWLGFVQGSMHADGYASVEELKRANMPEGDAFDREKT